MSQVVDPVSLAEIDRDLGSDRLTLEFSSALEKQYREESEADQSRSVIVNSLIGCVLYDMFLLSDYFVTDMGFRYYVIGRLFVMTPLCLIFLYFIWHKSRFYQILVCMPFVTMAFTLCFLIKFNEGGYRANYLFGDILLMMCGCAIARPRLPYAVMMVVVQFILYQATLLTTNIFDARNMVVSTLFCFSGGVVTIMTAYAIERMSRRAFLLSVRVRLMNRALETQARTDPLTGLANRRAFDEATARVWSAPAPVVRLVSLILIDVDRFKMFNDTYGHSAGDLCLATISRRVSDAVRPDHDLAVRFGGEEIIVLLPDTDFTVARRIAETIRLSVMDAAIPHPVIAPDAVVTASFGVATAPVEHCTAADLVIRADMALYAAKRNGRNQVWPPLGTALSDISWGSAAKQAS